MQLCETCLIKSKAAESLNIEELNFLSKNCAEVNLEPGENIIKEGIPLSHIAYLKEGLAKISKKGVKGYDQILKIVLPGSYLGMQTILSNKNHQYSVIAIEKSIVCYIDIKSFQELIKRNAQFAYELILFMCREEMGYFNRFVNVHQKQINGRLAETILMFANDIYNGSKEFVIPLSRNDLAALICSTRESVTRSIKDLSETGAIKVNAKNFKIENYELLLKLSEKG